MTLRDQAYETFTEQLLSRQISMGQFVSQRELVKITGMPLGAIREMIPRLEADGLIRTVPNRGLQIVQVDVGLIRNAFQLRAVLEREAVRNFVTVATDDELQELRRRHLDIREAALQGVSPQLLATAQQMDWDMHDRMIDALDNDIISAIYRTNSIKIRLIRNEDTRDAASTRGFRHGRTPCSYRCADRTRCSSRGRGAGGASGKRETARGSHLNRARAYINRDSDWLRAQVSTQRKLLRLSRQSECLVGRGMASA